MTVTIGQAFKRVSGDGPKRAKVIGQDGRAYVLTDADAFAAPFSLTGAQFLAQYGGEDGEPLRQPSEESAWESMTAAKLSEFTRDAAEAERVLRADMLPPEAIFDPNWAPPEPPPPADEHDDE